MNTQDKNLDGASPLNSEALVEAFGKACHDAGFNYGSEARRIAAYEAKAAILARMGQLEWALVLCAEHAEATLAINVSTLVPWAIESSLTAIQETARTALKVAPSTMECNSCGFTGTAAEFLIRANHHSACAQSPASPQEGAR